MRYIKLTILFCGLIWLCSSSTQLFASQVVTSGYICCFTPDNLFEGSAFDLSGPGFHVTGSFENPGGGGEWGVGYCYSCLPGTLLGVWGHSGGEEFNGGTATIGSTYYPAVLWFNDYMQVFASDFHVTGPPILLTGPGTFRGTFSFQGDMCGTFAYGDTACGVDLPSLTGSGIVTVDVVSFVFSDGSTRLLVTQAGYTFAPEPSSLLLFGPGALGIAGMLRRKLRRCVHSRQQVPRSS